MSRRVIPEVVMARARTVPTLPVPVPVKVRERLVGAERRLALFESEAQKLLTTLLEKGQQSRRELADIVASVPREEWEEKAGELREQAGEKVEVLRARLHDLPERALGLAGVATSTQLEQLTREVARLERKIEKISKAAAKRPRATAKKS